MQACPADRHSGVVALVRGARSDCGGRLIEGAGETAVEASTRDAEIFMAKTWGADMIRIGVAGAAGRMGRAIVQAAQTNELVDVVAAIEKSGSDCIGVDVGELAGIGALGVAVTDSLGSADYEVLIDFTNPGASVGHAEFCAGTGRRMVIGTTGLEPKDRQRIARASEHVAVVLAPNMSVGVNLCFRLAELAAQTLGGDVDVEILEAHHRHKVDAPSGTALRLGELVAAARGRDLDQCAVYARHGRTGARDRDAIGFATVRAGDIVGEHTVLFAAEGERVEITHRASSRMTFAAGAVRAAVWVAKQERGMFDMQDVLGLR